jgi:hypothetical protein
MNRRDIIIGFVILAFLIVGFLLLRRPNTKQPQPFPEQTPSSKQKIESVFNVTIPDDVQKAELKDIAGINGTALATRKFDKNFVFTVLADLPDPPRGYAYHVWISKDTSDPNADARDLGSLRIAKGGWILDYQSKSDLSSYNGVFIAESTGAEKSPQKKVMLGTF